MTEYTDEMHHQMFIDVCADLRDKLWASKFRYLVGNLNNIRDHGTYDDLDSFLEEMGYDADNWVEATTSVALHNAKWYKPWAALREIRAARALRDEFKNDVRRWNHAKMLLWIVKCAENDL